MPTMPNPVSTKPDSAKRLMHLFQLLFVLATAAAGAYQLWQGHTAMALRALLCPLFFLIPPVFRLLRLQPCYRLFCAAYVFSIFAFSYGCVYGAFKDSALSDKISHFLSGFLFTIAGICLYYFLSRASAPSLRAAPGPAASYGLYFSIFVGVCWEVCEMLDFVLTGNDSQHHLTTGVFDTMLDLTACLVASLLSALAFYLYKKKGIKLLTAWVVEEFYEKNILPRSKPAATAEATSAAQQ